MNWYYALNGQQQGPVPAEELGRLASAGVIAATTLVWRDGLADWQPLSVALPEAMSGSVAPQLGGVAVSTVQKDLIVQQMREGVTSSYAGAMRYAGFWIRFAAKFIDGLILFIPNMVIQFGLGAAIGMSAESQNPGEINPAQIGMMFLVMGLSMGLQAVYSIILTAKYGATWGKMAVGLKVVTAEGGSITWGRATGRFFAEMLSGLTLYIGYIIAGFDSEKRALHDHICGTRVIHVR